MSSMWNNGIKLSIFGESHSDSIGVVIDNLPPGEKIDIDELALFMKRRQAKSDGTTTTRIEPDIPKILCGIHNGTTNGTPICILIENQNTRSGDYANLVNKPRPAHADFTGHIRYKGENDVRGGGHFSGRLTACFVAAGAISAQILARKNIHALAHLYSVKDIVSSKLPMQMSLDEINAVRTLPFPFINTTKVESAMNLIRNAAKTQDSVGGIVECTCFGIPTGIGSPIFDNLESIISSLIFSIPGVKGLEFGLGFDSTQIMGSENNDEFYYDNNVVKTKTNHHGGILGGISSGMPISFSVAFKPTPSISREQNTVDLSTQSNAKLNIVGRHDPCIAVRGVSVVEACCNIAILSALINQNGI